MMCAVSISRGSAQYLVAGQYASTTAVFDEECTRKGRPNNADASLELRNRAHAEQTIVRRR